MTAAGAVAARIGAELGAQLARQGAQATAPYALEGRVPAAVALPRTAEEAAAVLALAEREGWAVVPWGGPPQAAPHGAPARYDLALSLAGLARLLDHDPENLTLTAEAGMTLAEANRLMRPRRQCLPAGYPHERRTLGGLVASGRVVPKRMLYGDLRDQVLALRVATAQGTLVRYGRKVIKNVAGYDMNKLFLGSEGVFGVIVEATFKLAALPDEEGGVLGAFPQRAGALACAAALYRSALLPASLAILDARAAEVFRSAQGLPARAGAAHLFAAFDGRAIALRRQTRDTAELMTRHGAEITDSVTALAPDAADALEYPSASGAPGVRLDLGVPMTELAAVWDQTAAELSQLGLAAAAVADYGAGRLQFGCSAPESAALPRLAEAIARWRSRLAPLGGHVAVRASVPGLAVAPWGDLERELPLLRAFKAQLDPHNILAPGRFI